MRPRPTRISVHNSQGVLIVHWDDNSECEYPFITLRAACPCAECREGHNRLGDKGLSSELEIPLQSVQTSELERVEMIGNYALQLVWKDGHSFGIYPWDYLRDLCPPGNILEEKK
ncbi:MAG: hypothetical protein AMJ88_00800 [Anaerolineae bacterium SM23_ 63]|nr:MAG: hypothetical protein AMJ88_00800 [Anaerolineae bacterium SM23_ 63]HEY45731.1 DUF971 domain-containing protein [Anaerolineae bacterium]